ncbi:MAG TPA: glutamate--cysteine ligase, partial [Burkholderiaceae bacterium]
TRARSLQTQRELLALPFAPALQERFVRASQESVAAQKAIEAADTMPFEVYREQYMSPTRLRIPRSAVTL